MPLTIFSHGGLTIFDLLGDSYDGTKVTLLPPTGVYTRIGDAGTTSHSLAANDDLLVSGVLEVDGVAYFDAGITSIGIYLGNGNGISTLGVNDNTYSFLARDNGVAQVIVGKVISAADPYFSIGRDDTGVATNAVTDMLVLQAGAGTNNEAQNFGLGVSVKLGNAASEVEERASLDFVLTDATNGAEDASLVVRLQDGGTVGDVATFKGSDKSFNIGTAFNLKRFYSIVTLATDGATTTVGLTPGAVIMAAAIRVSTAIAGLDSADHHIQLGVAGTTGKYVDAANGSAATSIAKNVKGHYTFDPTTDTEAAALILTITEGGDQTPSAGAVEVEVIYLAASDLANG